MLPSPPLRYNAMTPVRVERIPTLSATIRLSLRLEKPEGEFLDLGMEGADEHQLYVLLLATTDVDSVPTL